MKWWLLLFVVLAGCSVTEISTVVSDSDDVIEMRDAVAEANINQTKVFEIQGMKKATFAGGCFWCIESAFEYKGFNAVSGYSGGTQAEATYKQVSAGITRHREVVQVMYDPNEVTYDQLLDIYWRQIDPEDDTGSFVDRGFQYTSAIYYNNEKERKIAEASKKAFAEKYNLNIVTPIIKLEPFYVAEDYHQDYHTKNPLRYNFYRSRSGRDQFRESIYGDDKDIDLEEPEYVKPSDAELRKTLTKTQYKVTQQFATERPFENEYWNNHEEGVYVDIVSGETLFSSKQKYDSGTGWPSFTGPIEGNIMSNFTDYRLFYPRIELRSDIAGSHLGHILFDGPNRSARYCINSASLRFIPENELNEEQRALYNANVNKDFLVFQ